MTALEMAANAAATLSIALAAFNHVLTWPVGIVGCVLFAFVFHGSQLYADALLQVFFIATSAAGWWLWRRRDVAPVSRAAPRGLVLMAVAGIVVTVAYGALLHRFTDAYAPFADSAVLAFSVVAQLLLMRRRLETWGFWLLVNTVSVPLFASRGLTLTAGLYAVYWVNAWFGAWRWWREWQRGRAAR